MTFITSTDDHSYRTDGAETATGATGNVTGIGATDARAGVAQEAGRGVCVDVEGAIREADRLLLRCLEQRSGVRAASNRKYFFCLMLLHIDCDAKYSTSS